MKRLHRNGKTILKIENNGPKLSMRAHRDMIKRKRDHSRKTRNK